MGDRTSVHPIIIFGATGAVGSAIARRLAASGRRLHLAGRDRDRLDDLAAALGQPASTVEVTDRASLAAAIEAAAAPTGGLAGLVFAVGTINLKPLAALGRADFDRDWQVNARAAAEAVQIAAPALKAGTPAAVLLFSSVAVAQGFSAHASIAMAKGAVEGLTRALAAELAPQVRVNCIAPSLTRTPLAQGLLANETLARAIAEAHALRRLGEPDDIAGLGALLLGPEGAWITGQVIGVDGGRGSLRTKG